MRPVLLEMAGFGSFREPTTVDFTGAEYFALVGPTGSGKSTVIDAMTFALYGSVPRWDNARTVALALAPTVARGTVRFVFDVAARAGGTERYVVARELRRAASGGVSVRTARLERLRDPAGTGAVEEETEPVADGAPATTKAVEELLGLPFGDFTTCVVLPQGEFAEFLHTEPRKRQETLVRLLGLGVYDVIAKDANAEARSQEQRAQVLTEQLAGYLDDTVDAERAAAERVTALTAVRVRVDEAMPVLTAVAAELAEIEATVGRLGAERSRLTGVGTPAGLEELAARRATSAATSAVAREALGVAETDDTAAREAVAAAPARGPLELARRHHAERASIAAELPGARDRQAKARESEATAGSDAVAARAAVEEARAAREAAATTLADAREVGGTLAAERDALRAVTAPAGVDALGGLLVSAVATRDHAVEALAAAERADAEARSALAAAPDRAPVEQARRDHRALVDARIAHRSASEAADRATAAVTARSVRAEEASAHVGHARARRAAALRADLAAALRPNLAVGEECPVCTQAVAVLPGPLPEGDLAAADRALAAAEAALDEARRAEATAAADQARASAARQDAADTVERLTAALACADLPACVAGSAQTRPEGGVFGTPPAIVGVDAPGAGVDATGAGGPGSDVVGPSDSAAAGAARGGSPTAQQHEHAVPSAERIDAALAHLEALAASARAADDAVRRARAERDAATAEVETVRAHAAAAAAALRNARDPLVGLGAPAVDDGEPSAGWAALVAWASREADAREAALPAARTRYREMQDVHGAAERALQSAEEVAERRRREETAAARAEQEASGLVEQLERRDRELVAALRDAPDDETAAAQLERIGELEDALRIADAALRSARAAARAADAAAASVEREVVAAWAELRAARDPLVAFDAPPLGDDLVAAWAELVDWARAAAQERAAGLHSAEHARAAAAARRAEVVRQVLDDLAAHDVPLATAPHRNAAAGAPDATTAGSAADAATVVGDGAGAPPTAGAAAADGAGAAATFGASAVSAAGAEVASGAATTAVATALERARGAHARVVERRAAAARLTADRDAAVEAQQVAKMLGHLLRSDGFPRWLVASALDALVADASVSLAELSGGQFELTHENGEFLVVDHTDADARRPVKTLSGGETFQASLALALALSAQMSGLAAHGAARLESIFLDEGFGTLDEANLETVASTLETLAARGDRVVGVITHVPALAERVPVRFAVRRDQRSSSVTREGL
jgi:exonuclease SbcC